MLKKFFGLFFLSLILFSESANAKRTKWVKGGTYENEINWNSKLTIPLPPGKFELVERYSWNAWGLEIKSVYLANLKGNLINNYIFISELGSWTYQSDVRQILHEIMYMNKYDGCYPRGEYTIVKVRKKGAFNNCFRIRHIDIKKEIYHPDDPQDNSSNIIKIWIKKNDIELPSVFLCSIHWFMAPSILSNLFEVGYCVNPELNGASKSKFTTEETSEYHPSNIHQYPDKKKYMEEFIKLAAQRHKLFEQGLGAKERHKLDLSEFGVGEVLQKNINTNSNSNLAEEIKELDKLYKEGIITKDEFDKAKQKVLGD